MNRVTSVEQTASTPGAELTDADAEAVEEMRQVWRRAFTQRPLEERVAEQRFRVVGEEQS